MNLEKQNNEASFQQTNDYNVDCLNYAYAQGGEGSRAYGHGSIERIASRAEEQERRYIASHPGCTDAARDRMAERYRYHDGD